MVNAILGIICIGSLAAVFVLWAKLEEQKKMTQEEKEKRWDEISLSASIETERRYLESKIDFEEAYHKYAIKEEIERRVCAEAERDELQDRLSSALCPTNNHVWRDGVCVKCGRVKDV